MDHSSSLSPDAPTSLPWWRRWRFTLLVAFLLVALAVGAAEFVDVVRDYQHAEEMAFLEHVETVEVLAAATELFVARYRGAVRLAAQAIADAGRLDEAARRTVAGLRLAYPEADAVFVTDREGLALAGDPAPVVGVDVSDREYFRRLAAGAPVAVSDLIVGRVSQAPAVAVAAAIRGQDGALRGTVVVGLPLAELGRTLGARLRRGAFPLVVDRAGRVVVGGDPPGLGWGSRDVSRVPLVAEALAGRAARVDRFPSPLTGEPGLAALVPVPGLGWAAGVVHPVDVALAPASHELRLALTTVAIAFALGIVLALLLSARLSRPIAVLSAGVRAVARGDLRHRITAGWRDEYGRLAADFNAMARQLEAARAQEQTLNAELAAANRALERRVAELTTLLEVIPIGIAVAEGPECRRIRVNPAFAGLLGISPDANASMSAPSDERPGYRVYRHGRELPPQERPMETAAATGRPVAGAEADLVRPDGTTLRLFGHAAPLFDEQGRVRGCLGVFIDVSEHRRVEAERSDLLAREQAARAAAEAAERRAAFLAEASAALAASLDCEATLRSVARLAVPELTDWCVIDLLEPDGSIRPVATAHVDPAEEPLVRELERFPLDPEGSHFVTRALRTGRPAIVPDVTEEWLLATRRAPEHLAALRRLAPSSFLCVPLVARARTLGAITFATSVSGRRHGPADLPMAEELARRAALAVDNARLYEEAQAASRACAEAAGRARQYASRLRRLAAASLAIGSTLSIDRLVQLITERAREIVGAHAAATSQTVDQDWAQAISAVSVSDKYAAWRDSAAKFDGSGIYALVCRENRPMRMTQAELEAHPAWRGFGKETGRHLPLRGWLAAPLIGRDGKNLGLIQLSDRYEAEFTEEDEAILVQLAHMAAVAIENARLYREAQEAAREAQDAVRAREAFLARASHELRTPLTSAIGTVRLIRKALAGTLREPPESLIDIASRNLDAMLTLINHLLDASKLASGRETLALEVVDVADLARRSLEVVGIQAREKGLDVRVEVPQGLRVPADPVKLEQVLVNLLANAARWTPAGGEVRLDAEATERGVVIRVRDTGQGIAREHLERIFEPFFQVGESRRRARGTGLGLAICRQIVTLHGGRIWAESDGLGRGSTFTVLLPAAAAAGRAA